MSIECLRAVIVCNDDVVAVAAVPAAPASRDDDCSICGGKYGRAACRAEVYRISAVDTLRQDCARYRITIVTVRRAPASTDVRLAWCTRTRRTLHGDRGSDFAARDYKHVADDKRLIRVETVELGDFVGVTAVFLRNRFEGITLYHRSLNTGDGENDEGITGVNISCSLEVIGPDYGVD